MTLIKWHDFRPLPSMVQVRKAVNQIGEELFPLYLEVQRADLLSQSEYKREQKLERLNGVEQCYREIQEKEQCVSLKTLAVTGRDLMEAGMAPGKELGETLNRLLEAVLEHPEWNKKEILLNKI